MARSGRWSHHESRRYRRTAPWLASVPIVTGGVVEFFARLPFRLALFCVGISVVLCGGYAAWLYWSNQERQ